MQPRRDHPAVVAHQQVARPQVLADVSEGAVLKLSGAPVHDQQAGGIAGFDRGLGDQLKGQVIIEVAGFHNEREAQRRLVSVF
jgi:hypothetical protein